MRYKLSFDVFFDIKILAYDLLHNNYDNQFYSKWVVLSVIIHNCVIIIVMCYYNFQLIVKLEVSLEHRTSVHLVLWDLYVKFAKLFDKVSSS